MAKTRNSNPEKPVNILPLFWFLLLSPFFFGLFHEFSAAIINPLLFAYLFYLGKCRNKLYFYRNVCSVAVLLLVLGYLISILWAEDSGIAALGFLKFSPIAFFLLILMQLTAEEKKKLLFSVPISGAVMTILSFIGSRLAPTQAFFTVAERLAGFFQYPNTFALFLLLGVIVLATEANIRYWHWIGIAVLIFGIFMTGSRAVFVLLGLSLIALCVFHPKKKIRLALLFGILGIGILVFLYLLVTDNFYLIDRFLSLSVENSTFLGRFVYFLDALPQILKHPVGLGYQGYFFTQQQFQTAYYSVLFVHNELLQIFLDIGWIPAVACLCAFIQSLFTKGKDLRVRLMLVVLFIHCMFDFSLQFLSVIFVLMLLLDLDSGKRSVLKRSRSVAYTAAVAFSLFGIYLGTSQVAYLLGNYQLSRDIYPANTSANLVMMSTQTDPELAVKEADHIIKQNKNIASTFTVKAQYAYSQGKFEDVIQYEETALDLARYTQTGYDEYANMLLVGISLYEQAGDQDSAQVCTKRLIELKNRVEKLNAQVSPLAQRTEDATELTLSREALEYLKKV